MVEQGGIGEVLEKAGRKHLSSIWLETLIGHSDAFSVGIGSAEPPVKCFAGVLSRIDEEEEGLCGEQLCEK